MHRENELKATDDAFVLCSHNYVQDLRRKGGKKLKVSLFKYL